MMKKWKCGLAGVVIIGALAVFPMNTRAEGAVPVDANTFPDVKFRQYVSTEIDIDGNGILTTEEIEAVTSIDVCTGTDDVIKDMTGVGIFSKLEWLNCDGNQLTVLDLSKNTLLRYLYCSNNSLTSLDLSKNISLQYLNCDGNDLTGLDLSGNPLVWNLVCYNNNITQLDISNNSDLISAVKNGFEYNDGKSVSYSLWVMKDEYFAGEYKLWVDLETEIICDTVAYDSGWQEIDGKKYYNENGEPVTGPRKIDGKVYYFNKDGVMQTGVLKLDGSVYYMDPETGAMHTGWLDYKGGRYYFNSKGVMQTGAKKIDGYTYYFDKKSGKQVTGVLKTSEGVFYLDPDNNGAMLTGWLVYKNAKYYFGDNGKMVTGPKVIDGKTYYFDKKSGKMKTGVLTAGGKIFYLNKDGSMHIGWLTLKGNLYYLQEDGSLAVDCTLTIDGEQYSFGPDGVAIALN